MRIRPIGLVPVAALLLAGGCAAGPRGPGASRLSATPGGALAQIYYWRARPGRLDEYTRYIREHAEPIDAEARRTGAFLSVTTYVSSDTLGPWTHMRVFILRDSAQLVALPAALSAAGVRLEPDSVERRRSAEYASGLRDGAGSAVVRILK